MGKLIPVDITGLADIASIMDKCHDEFKKSMASKENRPRFIEKEIYVPLIWIDRKAEIFWHSASIEPKTKLDVLPCNNDIASSICESNCLENNDSIIMINGTEREKCIYRAMRIGWIKSVIEMFNNNDTRVKYWEKVNSKKKNRLYIRYQEAEIDYLVILEEKSEKRVLLITAFPIFFVSAKRDYELDYQNYIKRKS